MRVLGITAFFHDKPTDGIPVSLCGFHSVWQTLQPVFAARLCTFKNATGLVRWVVLFRQYCVQIGRTMALRLSMWSWGGGLWRSR
jgi:hypothetical protein